MTDELPSLARASYVNGLAVATGFTGVGGVTSITSE